VENRVDPRAVAAGKPLKEIDLPRECVLTAIIRGGELIIPRGETVLQPDDEVLALVHISQLDRLASLLRGSK
jgi:trk system potassium uptake protein TrkA